VLIDLRGARQSLGGLLAPRVLDEWRRIQEYHEKQRIQKAKSPAK
jgi:hypothetical protein